MVRRRQQRVAMVRTATVDGRRQQGPRRLGRLLRQRPTTVVGRHGRKAALEDKGRWWPGREGSGEEWQTAANQWGAMGGSKDRRRQWRKAAAAFRCDRGHRQRAGRRGIEVADGGRGDRGKKRQRAWLRQKRLRREGGSGGPARAATAGSDKEAREEGEEGAAGEATKEGYGRRLMRRGRR
ncbi:hypothetical protein BHE74_00024105 [Ensete ventricosum]|nr:hypothetical protein BHE74_00024105 [Ensete ventricosum]